MGVSQQFCFNVLVNVVYQNPYLGMAGMWLKPWRVLGTASTHQKTCARVIGCGWSFVCDIFLFGTSDKPGNDELNSEPFNFTFLLEEKLQKVIGQTKPVLSIIRSRFKTGQLRMWGPFVLILKLSKILFLFHFWLMFVLCIMLGDGSLRKLHVC